jgi:hypothetical protein
MATFVETFASLKAEMEKLGLSYDEALFEKVTKGLGPSIYNKDSSTVSCSDESELATVRKNFVEGKLGKSDNGEISKVCETMGKSNRNKYRAIFYYLLVKELGAESVYA